MYAGSYHSSPLSRKAIRPVDEDEHEQLERAGELREAHYGHEGDQHEHDRPGKGNRIDRSVEALADPAEGGRGECVPAHREGIARGGEYSSIGHTDGREDGDNGDADSTGCSEELARRDGHRRERVFEAAGRADADDDVYDERVDGHHQAGRAENAQRNVPTGVLDLLGDARDLGDARIRDELRGFEDATAAVCEKRVIVDAVDVDRAGPDEGDEREQHEAHDGRLEAAGLLDA